MTELSFLPAWPPALSQPVLFGALLAVALLAGEAAKRYASLPRITGFALAGIVLGPQVTGLLGHEVLAAARVLVDLSIGLIVFELGYRCDLKWLRRNPWLPVTALGESAFAFFAIYGTLLFLEFRPLLAAAAAAIGTATSPAVVMLLVHELRAEGQVTERMLLFTTVNCVFAYIVLTLLLPFLHLEHAVSWPAALLHPVYLLVGSVLAGLVACAATLVLARWLGKREDRQFILQVAVIVLTVGVARALDLSVMVTLVVFGMLARNIDRTHLLMPLRLGYGGQLFFLILFVLTGASLEFGAFAASGLAVAGFIVARFVGKAAALVLLGRASGLRTGLAGLLAVALLPMSGLAVVMVQDTIGLYPAFGRELASIVMAAVAVLALLGPIATQFALRAAGEAEPGERGG